MRKGFLSRVYRLIEKADLLLEVLDARFPELTRNEDIELKILNEGKKLVFVLNKSDLLEKETLLKRKKELEKIAPTVFLSAKERHGTRLLREEIGKATSHKDCIVGVIGYPNTGKSSIINALRGRSVAKTAPKAGFTRGEQFVRISDKIMLVDSPGIIPFEQRNEFELMLVNAKNAEQLLDTETSALKLISFLLEKRPSIFKELFGINFKDPEEILQEFAVQKKKFLKGGIPDLEVASKLLIQFWQNGKIKL